MSARYELNWFEQKERLDWVSLCNKGLMQEVEIRHAGWQ